jgi:hypothetical protein
MFGVEEANMELCKLVTVVNRKVQLVNIRSPAATIAPPGGAWPGYVCQSCGSERDDIQPRISSTDISLRTGHCNYVLGWCPRRARDSVGTHTPMRFGTFDVCQV